MVVLAAALAGFVGAVIGSSVSMSIRVRRVSDTGVSAQRDRTDAGQEAGSYAATDCEIDTLCCEDKSAAETRPEDRLEDFRRWLEERERAANTVQSYCASMRGFFRSYGEVSQKKRDGLEAGAAGGWYVAQHGQRPDQRLQRLLRYDGRQRKQIEDLADPSGSGSQQRDLRAGVSKASGRAGAGSELAVVFRNQAIGSDRRPGQRVCTAAEIGL